MKKLTSLQIVLYNCGGLILLIGAVLPLFQSSRQLAPFVYAAGAVLFCSIQLLARYDGTDITVRRLRRQQIIGTMFLLVTAALMFMSLYQTGPFQGSEWQMTLSIGALLEIYTAFRLPEALKKSKDNL